jgi:Ca2+-binding EF-hand superfamily protein
MEVYFTFFDTSGGTIAFPEFLKTTGKMFRGTVEEKAALSLSIIDLDGDKKIQRKELYEVCKCIEEITKLVPSVDNITPAEQVVDSIFALGFPTFLF